jgi:hypothetical protein
MLHNLTIPDALLDWAREPDRAIRFARPWVAEIEAILAEAPLNAAQFATLLDRLDALLSEAVGAGRHDLLLGFDIVTAEHLGLTYDFGNGDRVGPGERWSYGELRALLGTSDPRSALEAARAAKELLADVFPQLPIGAIFEPEADADACSGCGDKGCTVMLQLESGNHYCTRCWLEISTPGPKLVQRGSKMVVVPRDSR